MNRSRSLCALLFLTTLLASLPASAGSGNPFLGPPLSTEPAELLDYVETLPVPEGAAAEFFLHEVRISVDEKGRRTWRARLVYRPLTDEAARALGVTSASWAPWFEEKPELDARVITADGRVYRLDQKTLDEAPIEDGAQELFDDRRVVRAPIPGMEANAVVEEVIVTREAEPFFEAGTSALLKISQSGPIDLAVVAVEAPKSVPLRYSVRGLSAAPRRESDGELVRLILEAGPLGAEQQTEPFPPHEWVGAPHFAFSTGRSWKEVGEAYARLVEKKLAGADLGEIVAKATSGAKGREEVAERLADWVRHNIRYTGVHFGEAKIIPGRPQETIERRFGDCKDMSALLVALIRAAGHPAHVALVRTEWDDIDPALPGMGQFDHAIVYVPGKTPIWIDPTNRETAFGELPPPVLGKFALVAGAKGDGLLRTPNLSSSRNRLRITREMRLAEEGPGRIVETRESTGSIAAYFRASSPEDQAQRTARVNDYAQSIFGAASVRSFEEPPYNEVRDPYRTRLEMSGCARANSDGEEASATVSPAAILALMPDFLTEGDEEHAPGWRGQPMDLPSPYVGEIEHRIVPPPGFSALPLPEPLVREMGPAVFKESFSVEPDGTVVVRHSFDTGDGKFTAKEVEALSKGMRELVRRDDPQVRFQLQSTALEAAGKRKEAFAEHQRRIALHPTEARHHQQLARALLEAGFGTAAREEARQAVLLEPGSAAARYELGVVLMHDEVGRRLGPGASYAGAIAALREAKKLDPTHFKARATLAFLLEHDPSGQLFGPGADLEGALAEYRELLEMGPDNEDRLLLLLARLGRLEALREQARKAKPTAVRAATLLAAVAGLDGVPAALAEAARVDPNPQARRDALESASELLVQLRRYPEAAALLREAAMGAPNSWELQARFALLEKVRRFEAPAASPETPEAAFRLVFAKLLLGAPEAELKPLFSRRAHLPEEGPRAKASMTSKVVGQDFGSSLPPEALLDVTESLIELSVEGDAASGWRVISRAPMAPMPDGAWCFVREDGAIRLLAMDQPETMALEALQRAERGELDAARLWLRWSGAQELERGCPGEDAKQTLRRSAARALATTPESAAAIPVLVEALDCAVEARREEIAIPLANAYLNARKGEELLKLAEQEKSLDDEPRLQAQTRALNLLGRDGELRKVLRARLERKPRETLALEMARIEAMRAGDFAEIEALSRKLIDDGDPSAGIYNDLAWLAAFRPPVTEAAIDLGRRAVARSNERSRPALHTLATLYAESGRPDEAMQVIRKSLDLAPGEPLEPEDWYPIGRAAEEYGLIEEARRCYAKVTEPEKPYPLATWTLARRRLEKLEASQKSGR